MEAIDGLSIHAPVVLDFASAQSSPMATAPRIGNEKSPPYPAPRPLSPVPRTMTRNPSRSQSNRRLGCEALAIPLKTMSLALAEQGVC